jgi:hypothetical protein
MPLLLKVGLGSAVMSESVYLSSYVDTCVLLSTGCETCVLAVVLFPVIKQVGDFRKATKMITPVG